MSAKKAGAAKAPKAKGKQTQTRKQKKVAAQEAPAQPKVANSTFNADDPALPRMGRPPKLENTDFVRNIVFNLARMHCTLIEAAATLGVSEPTFRKFLSENPGIQEAWDLGPHAGKASLRRSQWKSATAGNAQLLKWLGKQYLGQADKVDLRGPNGGALQTISREMTLAEAAAAYAAMAHGGA